METVKTRGRPKGTPKTGGRQRGVLNKKRQTLLEAIQERFPDYHPVLAMAQIANDETLPDDLRFNAHKEVSQYILPKLRSVEVSGNEDKPLVTEVAIRLVNGS